MKKKEYEKPTTMVVKLEQQNHLLAGSVNGGLNGLDDYDNGGDPFAGV